MKLYDYAPAPNPKRIRMLLAEKNLELETIQVDLRKIEQFSEEFKQINPRCTVPALVCDDGTVLTENIAIADYLENHYPEPAMFGNNAYERAQVFTWNAICEKEGFLPIAEIFRNSVPAFKGRALPGTTSVEQLPELVERGHHLLQSFFPKLDQQLSQFEFLVSDSFTYADITAYITWDFLAFAGLEQPSNFKNINRWLAAVDARPSATII